MAAKLTRMTQNSDTTAPSGKQLYHLQFQPQAASPETYGYTLVRDIIIQKLYIGTDFIRQIYNIDYGYTKLGASTTARPVE
jgi:hypothetical protein